MIFEYKIILPMTVQDKSLLTETVNSFLAELTATETKYAEVKFGNNYRTLDWKEGASFPPTSSLIATKMLPGAGSFACFNVENDRPIYKNITQKDIEGGD